MKKELWKIGILILMEAVCCRISLMGLYPFAAALFFAVYMEDFYRKAWLGFTGLFLVLWLPVADLFRYGMILLVWMVILAIASRMQLVIGHFGWALAGGAVTAVVSWGGQRSLYYFEELPLLPWLEGMLVAGLSYFACGLVERFRQWEPQGAVTVSEEADRNHWQTYAKAMGGLSRQLQDIMADSVAFSGESQPDMHRELQYKVCRLCRDKQTCLAGNEGMAIAIDAMIGSLEQGQPLEEEARQNLLRQCHRAEVMMHEAIHVFEKMQLNQSWYGRLREHRQLIADQIDAMAMVMEDYMEQQEMLDQKETWALMQLKFRLREAGIRVLLVHLYQKKNGAWKLELELKAGRRRCMTMKELTDRINSCFPKAFTPAAENRSIVGREKSYYIFWTCTRLICNWGAAGMIQQGQNTSGDSFRSRQLEDGRFIMALSDGMGSGEAASKESTAVVDLLLQFLEAGFTMDVALGLMNGAMIFGAEKERFSTLDVCLVDCHTGITELYKVGGHVSFLKHKNSVEIAEASGPPMGAGAKVDTSPNRCFLAPGESLVMVTDGVLEYLHVKDPAACLQQLIAELSEEDAAAFSRRILERVLLYTGGTVQDDMTILTIKIQER